jgi:hypothetical protein
VVLAILTATWVFFGVLGCALALVYLLDALADLRAIGGSGPREARRILALREVWAARLSLGVCALAILLSLSGLVPGLTVEHRAILASALIVLIEVVIVSALAVVVWQKWKAEDAIREYLRRQGDGR